MIDTLSTILQCLSHSRAAKVFQTTILPMLYLYRSREALDLINFAIYVLLYQKIV